MTSTRNFKAPGQFAADAVTTIPGTPTLGVAYRDTTTTDQDSEDGWPYGMRVDSATFNQILYQLSGIVRVLDSQGILGWTNLVDYPAGALVLGSDLLLYRAKTANGPASSLSDPAAAGAAWERYGAAAATAVEVTTGSSTDKFVSPATLIAGFLGGASLAAAGVARFPVNVGGVRVEFIAQWGGGNQGNGSAVAFPIAFPNACFRVIGSDSNGLQTFGTQSKTNTGFILRTNAGGTLQFDYLAIGW